jgi:hypothetical protein
MARITVVRIRRATLFRPPSTAIAQGDATPLYRDRNVERTDAPRA